MSPPDQMMGGRRATEQSTTSLVEAPGKADRRQSQRQADSFAPQGPSITRAMDILHRVADAYANVNPNVKPAWAYEAEALVEEHRRALLDASRPVKPPTLPEPDLRLMGEAVKGGKYPEQPVKP